ncbi:MAG TPA: hypothetical protein VF297_11225 [Pyrinomonadaceae bacterium]
MRLPIRVVDLLFWPAAAAVLFGPLLVGAFDSFPAAAVAGLLLLLNLYAFSPLNQSVLPRRISLVVLSACLAATAFDLGARAVFSYFLDETPKELVVRAWPPLPLLNRFPSGVRFEGEVYGDLAGMSGHREWREYRPTLFVTDERGLRNEPSAGEPEPDLILLGDSFGVVRGTRQDETLGALLSRSYGWSVYNLSMEAVSPWQEYANLLAEGDGLRPKEGAVLLWLIFPGNDLDERYLPVFEASQLPWRGRRGQLVDAVRRFRYRSPLRYVLFGRDVPGSESVIEKKFLDGRRLLFLAQYARNNGRTAEDVRRHPNFALLRQTIGAMKRLADERRLRVTVALVPSKEEIYSWVLDGAPPWSTDGAPSPFSAAVEEMARQNGMPYLDLKPALVGASRRAFEESGQLLWWADDTHWNPLAQKVAAEAIQRELLLPLRPRL